MANFFTLTCPICGGDLKITKDIERFACVYCGKEHIVKRGDGIISIAPVLVNVSKGVDSTASELAMVRLNKELAELKPYLLRANNEANKFLVEMQFRIPAIVGTVVFMLGGILLLIFTDVYLLALLFFLIGIVFIGYTFHLHSNEYRNSRNEAVEKAYMLQTLHNKLRDDYSYHYERANKR